MKEDILPINFLRFLAAFGVLVVHKFSFLIDIGYLPKFLSFLIPVSSYGYLGVDLFFLISGFVIALSSEGRTAGQFISARFIRLFPVFWVCVSITSLCVFLAGNEHITLQQFLANLTMMPELYGGHPPIDGSYWTLGIELRFYMFVAFILLLRTLITIPLQKIALLLSFPLLYLTIYFSPYSISFIDNILLKIFYYFGSEYAHYFIAGILFYAIYKNKTSYYYYIALSICYIIAILQAFDHAYSTSNPKILVLYMTVFFGIFLGISLRKINNASMSFLGKHSRKVLITLGAITYPLYLLHSKIMNITINTFIEYKVPTYIASPLLILTIILLVLVVNQFDYYITMLWKQSSVVKNMLARNNSSWLKKII